MNFPMLPGIIQDKVTNCIYGIVNTTCSAGDYKEGGRRRQNVNVKFGTPRESPTRQLEIRERVLECVSVFLVLSLRCARANCKFQKTFLNVAKSSAGDCSGPG